MELDTSYPCDSRNYEATRTQAIRFLVIHYVGSDGDAKNNAVYFGRTNAGASAHYFVGHGATGAKVYQSVPPEGTAWHVGSKRGYRHPKCRNSNSIGIELCCHRDGAGRWYFDPETVDVAAELAREIVARYGIPPENLLRHYDVSGKNCPEPFVSDPAAWEKFKALVYAPEGETEMTKLEIEQLVKETVERELANRDEAAVKAAQKVSPWAKDYWARVCKRGLFDGTRPGAPLTREQAAAVIERMGR